MQRTLLTPDDIRNATPIAACVKALRKLDHGDITLPHKSYIAVKRRALGIKRDMRSTPSNDRLWSHFANEVGYLPSLGNERRIDAESDHVWAQFANKISEQSLLTVTQWIRVRKHATPAIGCQFCLPVRVPFFIRFEVLFSVLLEAKEVRFVPLRPKLRHQLPYSQIELVV